MLGAIFGDIAGSPYEFNNIKTEDFPIISRESRFTDDTVMTVAVAKALMDSKGKGDNAIKAAVRLQMRAFGKVHGYVGYGARFKEWLKSDSDESYGSYGNGSAMRVSPVGWMYDSLERTLEVAKLTAEVTHDHPEGIKGAQAVAAAIFFARHDASKEEIKNYIEEHFGYNLSRTLAEIRPGYTFDVSCQGSVPEAIIAFLESNGYVDAVRKAISIGGDSDTIACIAGGIAEAYYGMPEQIRQEALSFLTRDMKAVYYRFRDFIKNNPKGLHEASLRSSLTEDLSSDLSGLEKCIDEFYKDMNDSYGEQGKVLSPEKVYKELERLLESEAEMIIVVEPMETPNDFLKAPIVQVIQDVNGNLLFPVFTSEENASGFENPYGITDTLENVLEAVKKNEELSGVVINPFGKNFLIQRDGIDYLLRRRRIPKPHTVKNK